MRKMVWVGACVAVGLALIYFGGWHVHLGGFVPISFFRLEVFDGDSFALGSGGLLVRFNTDWYGIYMDTRFFDSPIIQWVMLWMGFSALGYALKEFLRGARRRIE